jgi:hypothetical protein
MSDQDRGPEPPVWRQILGAVWRTEKDQWREAARIGLVGGVVACVAAGTIGYLLFGWLGLLAGAVGGLIVGWLLLVLLLQSASLFP